MSKYMLFFCKSFTFQFNFKEIMEKFTSIAFDITSKKKTKDLNKRMFL